MSDLISKSETIDLLYQVFEKHSMATDKNDFLGGFGAELFKNIKAMPTAYSVDKVVEELKQQAEQYRHRGFEAEKKGFSTMADKYYGKQCSYEHAIKIVKAGGNA